MILKKVVFLWLEKNKRKETKLGKNINLGIQVDGSTVLVTFVKPEAVSGSSDCSRCSVDMLHKPKTMDHVIETSIKFHKIVISSRHRGWLNRYAGTFLAECCVWISHHSQLGHFVKYSLHKIINRGEGALMCK